jgi:hypothetical protein
MATLKEILEDLDRDLAEEKEELLPRCFICGYPPYFTGHLEKSNPTRLLKYYLCQECYQNPESLSIVEKIICYYETTIRDNPDLLNHCGEC